jgi:hypothetical protein
MGVHGFRSEVTVAVDNDGTMSPEPSANDDRCRRQAAERVQALLNKARGGNPLIVNGKVIGAIGVSGGTGSQNRPWKHCGSKRVRNPACSRETQELDTAIRSLRAMAACPPREAKMTSTDRNGSRTGGSLEMRGLSRCQDTRKKSVTFSSKRKTVCTLLGLRWLALLCSSRVARVGRADPNRRRASHGSFYRSFYRDRCCEDAQSCGDRRWRA